MEPQETLPAAGVESRRSPWLFVIITVSLALLGIVYAVFGTNTAPTLGDLAPAFKVTTQQGVQINSVALRGSVVVVNFFASWCEPCREEAPAMEALWREFKGQKVLFLGIAYEDTESKAAEFIGQYGITFPIAEDTDRISSKFGLTGVPETYVLDRDGVLVHKTIGAIDPAELRQVLQEHLR